MKKYLLIVFACLTLGLTPYFPEPHIIGKIRWILGGAKDMQLIDWADAVLHGSPWLVLLYVAGRDLFARRKRRSS
ncbi:MAG: hypothetical protein ONB46_14040 [candidate division KSB1 bacterium]|nr:hypothetical protein [candidate division KSB1 bacterium]MDZ7366941.1 hypothetical protein [candidate division KSB1 bacterium]MDZ7406826.1 hypothetical protein [candidate division KSB1 bacterium]